MKNAYKFLIYSLILITISSCTKEIKIVKGPTKNTNPYNGFALFSVGNGPLDRGLSISAINLDSQLYSLDLTGKETLLEREDGSLFQNVGVEGFKPVKSGLIFGLRESFYDSVLDQTDTLYNIYFTSDGKVAKKISTNNSIFSYDSSYKNPTNTNGFNYFCTSQGVLEWNDASKSLTNVYPLDQNLYSSCYGSEFGNEFFAFIKESVLEEDGEESYQRRLPPKLIRFSHKASSVEVTVLRDHADLENSAETDMYNLTKLDDEIFFTERYYRTEQSPFVGIIKINNTTLESSILIEAVDQYSIDTYFTGVHMLFRGEAVNNKIYIFSERGHRGEASSLLEETTGDLIQSTEFHRTSKLFSYSKATGLVELSTDDSTFGQVDYQRSGDKVFILKYNTKAFYINGSQENGYYTDNHLKLLDETGQSLIYDFGVNAGSMSAEIQKNGVILITNFETRFPNTNPKLTVYSLPNFGQGVLKDSRFDLQKYREVMFIDFYDKTLFQYDLYPEDGQENTRNSKIGFFGDDGEIKILDKDNVSLNSGMKL